VVHAFQRSRTDQTLRREGDVMGLTVAIALLVALSAGDDFAPHSKLDVLAVVWGTTVGLSLTHAFALTVSARLVHDDRYRPIEVLLSQMTMAVVVAACATAAVVVVSGDLDRLGARITAALFIGILVGIESRAGGSSIVRTLVLAATATLVAVALATAKWLLGR
jgi:hypothetical protein